MARPLRIDLEDGWYRVISRGIERRRIFQGVADFNRFIEVRRTSYALRRAGSCLRFDAEPLSSLAANPKSESEPSHVMA
jgi:hypothetical protein